MLSIHRSHQGPTWSAFYTWPKQGGEVIFDCVSHSWLFHYSSNQELNKIGTETDTMPHGNTQKSHLKPVENDGNSNEYVSDGCQVIKVYRTVDQAFKYFIINKVSGICIFTFVCVDLHSLIAIACLAV